MRTLKKMSNVIFVLILGLVGTYSPALAQNWRPISHITEKEVSLIEQTVDVLKIPVDLNKVEYYRLDGNYMALRFDNEDRFIGPLSQNTNSNKYGAKDIKKTNESSYIDTPIDIRDSNPSENNCNLNEFFDRWSNNPDDISDELLEKLDNLVDAAVRLCPPGKLNTIALGLRGNAFRKYINNRSFSVKELMFFWDSYISSDRARTVDFPTQEDVQFAIQQIHDLLLNNPSYNGIKVYSTTEAIIRTYNKETYKLLKSRKLTNN